MAKSKGFVKGSFYQISEDGSTTECRVISANKRLVVEDCDGNRRWFKIIDNGYRVWAVLDSKDLDNELTPICTIDESDLAENWN